MSAQAVRVQLLGPVDVTVGDTSHPLPGLRRKSVLAVLALHPNTVVSADTLVDTVWGSQPPPSVASSLQGHISHLRRVLRARGAIEARNRGYQLNLPPDAVDVSQAMQLIASAAQRNDHADSAAQLTAALELWRGPSLVDVAEVAWLRDQGRRLDEARLEAVERLAAIRLALGEHSLLVAELEGLAVQYPFREHLHHTLIVALYRSGRQADALAAYHRLRRALASELGIDPSPVIRDLEAAILRQDPRLDPPPQSGTVTSAAPVLIIPAQLPPTITVFTGRQEELARLHALSPSRPVDGWTREQATPVVLVSGMAGVGKTTLAVHWAHQVTEQFPDGQLYVDLCGFDPRATVVDPAEAVRGFLEALGVPPERIPASVHGQVSLYRSVLAGRRVLVVIDNARDEQQVRPLLPGAPGCMAVVTSRSQLPGLVAADGAHPLTIERPSSAEARELFARRLDAQRILREPAAADDVIALCDRLPLALAIVAARAALNPTRPLAALAAQLRDVGTLDRFNNADSATNVRTVFSWSYDTLSASAAWLFRLLSLCTGPDISLTAAASLAGRPTSEIRSLLAELTGAHLLLETSTGRFGFHELLRAYAVEQAQDSGDRQQLAAARQRLLDHYLHTAHLAALLLKPGRSPLQLDAPTIGTTLEQLADRNAALTWFTRERAVLLATATREPDGHDRHTWQLAWAGMAFLTSRGDLRDNERIQQAGSQAARRLGDRTAQAHAHRSLGKVYADLGGLAQARRHSQAALRLFEQLDNPVATTDVQLNMGAIAGRQGDLRQALSWAQHAHDSYRLLGHAAGQGYATYNIGWCHDRFGNHQAGLRYYREALDIFTEVGDLEATAIVWGSLGCVYFTLGDQPQAEHSCRQAIALYRALGDRFREADIHANLGDHHLECGNPHAARHAWRQAVAILDDLEPEAAQLIKARLEALTHAG